MVSLETFYDAAAAAGLLVEARWTPDGAVPVTAMVEFRAPDETLLEGFVVATDYTIRYPASRLVGLAAGDVIEVAGNSYRVRDLRAIGDGTERRADLTRI